MRDSSLGAFVMRGLPLALNAPITPALLRLNPMCDPLRDDALLQKLLATPGVNSRHL